MSKKLELQEIKCGVPTNMWSPFDITKYRPKSTDANTDIIYKFLSERITIIGSPTMYWIKDGTGSEWISVTSKAVAIETAYSIWAKHSTLGTEISINKIGKDDFKKFIGKLPAIQDVVQLPVPDCFVMIRNKVCLNQYIDRTIKPSLDDGDVLDALPILRMMKYSLCAEQQFASWLEEQGYAVEDYDEKTLNQLEFEFMLNDIQSVEHTNFRWAMHWLANIRQHVGICSTAALFVHGESTGIGKNTLMHVMRDIMGSGTYKIIGEEDWLNGWTSNVEGALIAHSDDWKPGTIRKQEPLLKRFIGNVDTPSNKRHRGEVNFINTSSWFFSNNDNDPVRVNDNERRYTMILTTEDLEMGRRYASIVFNNLQGSSNVGIEAFNTLLCCIEVDREFVKFPLENEHRQILKETNKDFLDEFIEWVLENEPGLWLTSAAMLSKLKGWYKDTREEELELNTQKLGGRLRHKQKVKSDKQGNKRGWRIGVYVYTDEELSVQDERDELFE